MAIAAAVLQAARAEAARAAAACSGVELIALFGSVARGQPMMDSDADIAVLGGDFWDALRIGSEIGRSLGREPHLVDLATANDLLRFQIARDGIPLFQRTDDDWPRFQARSAISYFDVAPIVALCAEGVRRRLAREASGG